MENNEMYKNELKSLREKVVCGVKKIDINNHGVYFWYANNKGRGKNNCTIAVVKPGVPRASVSAKQHGVVYTDRVVAWRGNPVISKKKLSEIINTCSGAI